MGKEKTSHDAFTMPRRWTYRLPPAPFKLYAALLNFTSLKDGCYASNATVGQRAGMSRRSVTRWAAVLERQNVLTRVERQNGQATTSWTIMHDEVPPENKGFAAYKESKLAEHEAKHGPLPPSIRRTPYPPSAENGVPSPSQNCPPPIANDGVPPLAESGAQVIPTTSSEVVGMEIDPEEDRVESESTTTRLDSTIRDLADYQQASDNGQQAPVGAHGTPSANTKLPCPPDSDVKEYGRSEGDFMPTPSEKDPQDQVEHQSRVELLVRACEETYKALDKFYEPDVVRQEAEAYVRSSTEIDRFTDFVALIRHGDKVTTVSFDGIAKFSRNLSPSFTKNLIGLNNRLPLSKRQLGNTKAEREGSMTKSQREHLRVTPWDQLTPREQTLCHSDRYKTPSADSGGPASTESDVRDPRVKLPELLPFSILK